MRIVVTGAGGFVGRQIVERLLARGDAVVGIDTVAGGIPAGAEVVAGDLGDAAIRGRALAARLRPILRPAGGSISMRCMTCC